MAYTQIRIRRDTTTNWITNDPVLAEGELVIDTTTHALKIGDGFSNWSSTNYANNFETIVIVLTKQETDLVLDNNIPGILFSPYNMAITSVRADVDVAPTGSAIVVDMKKNGTTMLDASKIIIPADSTGGAGSLVDSSLSVGDKLTFSLEQIGSTAPGQCLFITIHAERL